MRERVPCKICKQLFHPTYLTIHKRIHTGEKPYRCSICHARFMFHSGIHHHMKSAHKDISSDDRNRLEYEYIKRGQKPKKGLLGARCSICNKIFPNLEGLRAHSRIHAEPENFMPYQCKKCLLRFSCSESYIEHDCEKPSQVDEDMEFDDSDNVDLTVKCTHCSKTFPNDNDLAVHMKIHNNDNLLLRCSLCFKFFRNKAQLRAHVEEAHSENSIFSCKKCGKQFTKKFRLDLHMRSHSTTMAHSTASILTCRTCDITFDTAEELVKHYAIHTKRERFPVHRKVLIDKPTLNTHMKMHGRSNSRTNLRPNQTFKCQDLHEKIHDHPERRPYRCTKCGAGFLKEFTCRLHMSSIHKIKIQDSANMNLRQEVHECVTCLKVLDNHVELVEHMKTAHSNENRSESYGENRLVSSSENRSTHSDEKRPTHSGENRQTHYVESRPANSGENRSKEKNASSNMYDNAEPYVDLSRDRYINAVDRMNKLPRSRSSSPSSYDSYTSDNDTHDVTSTTSQPSWQAKDSTSPLFLTNVRNKVGVESLDWEDESQHGVDDSTQTATPIYETKIKTYTQSMYAHLKELNEKLLKTHYINLSEPLEMITDPNTRRSVYKCHVCHTTFTMKENFRRHIKNKAYNHGYYLKKKSKSDYITKRRRFNLSKTPVESIATSRYTNKADNAVGTEADKTKQEMRAMMKRYKYICDVCGLSYTRKLNMRQHRNKHTDEAFKRAGVDRESLTKSEIEIARMDKIASKLLDNGPDDNKKDRDGRNFDVYVDMDEVQPYEEMINTSSQEMINSSSQEMINVASQAMINTASQTGDKDQNAVEDHEEQNARNGEEEQIPDKFIKQQNMHDTSEETKRNDDKTTAEQDKANVGPNKANEVVADKQTVGTNTVSVDTAIIANYAVTHPSSNESPDPGNSAPPPPSQDQSMPSTSKSTGDKDTKSEPNQNNSNDNEDTKVCPGCTLPILAGQKTIECQLCNTNFCVTCSGIPRRVYELAFEDVAQPPVVWFCKICRPLFPKLTVLLRQLGQFEESINDKVSDLEKKLYVLKKCQTTLKKTNSLNNK